MDPAFPTSFGWSVRAEVVESLLHHLDSAGSADDLLLLHIQMDRELIYLAYFQSQSVHPM